MQEKNTQERNVSTPSLRTPRVHTPNRLANTLNAAYERIYFIVLVRPTDRRLNFYTHFDTLASPRSIAHEKNRTADALYGSSLSNEKCTHTNRRRSFIFAAETSAREWRKHMLPSRPARRVNFETVRKLYWFLLFSFWWRGGARQPAGMTEKRTATATNSKLRQHISQINKKKKMDTKDVRGFLFRHSFRCRLPHISHAQINEPKKKSVSSPCLTCGLDSFSAWITIREWNRNMYVDSSLFENTNRDEFFNVFFFFLLHKYLF